MIGGAVSFKAGGVRSTRGVGHRREAAIFAGRRRGGDLMMHAARKVPGGGWAKEVLIGGAAALGAAAVSRVGHRGRPRSEALSGKELHDDEGDVVALASAISEGVERRLEGRGDLLGGAGGG